jgi:hypothetical protein
MKIILVILLSAGLLISCRVKTGSGNIITENRNETNFKGVNVGGNLKVHLKQGSKHSVRIEADDNIIEDIETKVRAGKLHVHYKDNVSLRNISVHIYIESPEINYVSASASADVMSEGILQSNGKIEVHSSSAGKVVAELDAPSVEADASSGSHITLRGRTRSIDTQASSGASLDADELLSENAKAQASSGASIDLHASVRLNAQASSGASVDYRGSASVSRQESSGGSIKKLD